MDRRSFLLTTMAPALAGANMSSPNDFRSQFARLQDQTYLNLASMAPLGQFALKGINRALAWQELGPGNERGDYMNAMRAGVRGQFARLVGAKESEIGLVHCTKAGEQIAIDAVAADLHRGANLVTNDLHFSGSLHNLVGLRETGVDVRIVKAVDWQVSSERLIAEIDNQTALVCVSLVSNVNGHLEDLSAICQAAHAKGALVFADIIQAAGTIPVNLEASGVDVAACSCYKYLYGVYGTGFLYVRDSVQGDRVPDTLFPGNIRYNYAPWVDQPEPNEPDFSIHRREDATRYQPGHLNYAGYCATYEALQILLDVGVDTIQRHASGLTAQLIAELPADRFRCITQQPERVALASFLLSDVQDTRRRLEASRVVVTVSGNRMRVAPALFNTPSDVQELVEVLS